MQLFLNKKNLQILLPKWDSRILIAPCDPSTNGQEEKYLQILKTKLKCMWFQSGTLREKLCELLFHFRTTHFPVYKFMYYLVLHYFASDSVSFFQCISLPLVGENCYISFSSGNKITRSFCIPGLWQQSVDLMDFINCLFLNCASSFILNTINI